MRTILVIILTLLTNISFGQQRTIERDVLEIIKAALSDNKLPTELINNTDSLYAFKGVAIESTSENKLIKSESLKWDKVELWIWGLEYMFEGDLYWLTPSKIKIHDSTATFDFKTNSWTDKKLKYYKGTIKAVRKEGRWVITKSRMTETKNSFDAWKTLKEQYEREKKENN